MKILVIDDTKTHLNAALQTLTDHDVTICSSHDDALGFLRSKRDDTLFDQLRTKYEADGDSRSEAYDKAATESAIPYWDVVLCDLLMPAGRNAQGNGLKYVGQEMPVGWSLALTAAKRGAKYVAVVTDINHHDHPASAMLDNLNEHIFTVDGSKVLMTNYVNVIGITGTEGNCTQCGGSGKNGERNCYYCNGTGMDFTEKGKDWGKILRQLIGEDTNNE